ncbi:hypothetical protein K491DRAFT_57101 [Lophiostoma macrostomum CBS 122681]|uniref:DUF7730 domain-containing protein n=1 Tax=Lophiostoma macrostomum CBS 122681 TaxID=1314788 RepID=A0A6A6SZB1_9PLEO|nr:hypothetical protein K491DRAFT_57101 [Lophiostoma macrostomum CBS 122681]
MGLTRAQRREYWWHTHPKARSCYQTAKPWVTRTLLVLFCPVTCPLFCIYVCLYCPFDFCGGREQERKNAAYKEDARLCRVKDTEYQLREEKLTRRKSLSSQRTRLFRKAKIQEMDQLQSPLFSKLPAEIRIKIYSYLLADNSTVHIWTEKERPIRLKCRCDLQTETDPIPISIDCVNDESSEDMHLECFAYYSIAGDIVNSGALGRGYAAFEEGNQVQLSMLPLLRTCRRVYKEALPLLYAEHTFTFVQERDFINFARSVPRSHLGMIRSLNIYKEDFPPGAASMEDATYACLSHFTSLRRCNIAVVVQRPNPDLQMVLDEIKQLGRSDKFTVHLFRWGHSDLAVNRLLAVGTAIQGMMTFNIRHEGMWKPKTGHVTPQGLLMQAMVILNCHHRELWTPHRASALIWSKF